MDALFFMCALALSMIALMCFKFYFIQKEIQGISDKLEELSKKKG